MKPIPLFFLGLFITLATFGETKAPPAAPAEAPTKNLLDAPPAAAAPAFGKAPAAESKPAATTPAPDPIFTERVIPAEPPGPIQLLEVFSSEQNPGGGGLEYTQGTNVEAIKLGAESGYYGIGLVFRQEALPKSFRSSFPGRDLIQIVLGTLKSKSQGQVPQFGSLGLLSDGIPNGMTIFSAASDDKQTANRALMMFQSPSTAADQTGEEKLRTTYFAQGGNVRMRPLGAPKTVEGRAQLGKYAFKMVLTALEFDFSLSTPFNAQESLLRGRIEIPLYWADSPRGDALIKQLAQESFSLSNTLSSGLAKPERKPAQKKERKPTRPRGM